LFSKEDLMKCRLIAILASIAVTALTVLPSSAAAAAPCVAGAAYNPTCDVNQDGHITVTDIQLTAGHWNQSGTFVSDNSHTHLGQTWTGASNPLKIQGTFGSPDYAALVLNNTSAHGLAINSVGLDGIYVGTAGAYGVAINDAAWDGVYVGTAGNPSSAPFSGESNGFEIAGAEGNGLYVGRADGSGVYVASAGLTGVTVHNAPTGFFASNTSSQGFYSLGSGSIGLGAGSSASHGVSVSDAGGDGVHVWSAANNGVDAHGNQYAGYFWGNINVTGNCIGCLQANFGVNVGERALEPGDVVSVQAVMVTDFDAGAALWQVTPAQPGQAAVGVVAGFAELVVEDDHRPSETGKRLVPREGAAQPGEYVTIVYSGPMQVRAAGPIAAGVKLTVDDDGLVRNLRRTEVNGVSLAEDAPVLGIALSALESGFVWVLVNPQ
jgi:hypothetical protein